MAASEANPAGPAGEAAQPTPGAPDGNEGVNEPQPAGDEQPNGDEQNADDGADDAESKLTAAEAELARVRAENAKLLRESRKHEERAKANSTAAAELEQIRTKDLPEHDKALAEARKQGRQEATMEFGQKLARAEFRAATVGRLDDAKLTVMLDGLNLARFVDDDGEADRDAITAYVESILPPASAEPAPAPKQPRRPSGQPANGGEGDIGQGAGRGAQPEALNGDGLQRSLERAVGLRQ